MKQIEERTLKVTLTPKGEPIFCEEAITFEIEDEAAGEYITIRRNSEGLEAGQIWIEPKEWETFKTTVDKLMLSIRKENP